MSATPQGTVGPQGRPFAFHTRSELGDAFSRAARAAMGERRRGRARTDVKWWCHPDVEAVLAEIELRFYEECFFEELQLSLLDAMGHSEKA